MSDELDPQAEAVARGDVLPAETPADDEKDTATTQADAKAGKNKEPEDKATANAAADADIDADKSGEEEEEQIPMIPQTRFKEAVDKERGRAAAAEAELKRYREREQQQADAADFEKSQAKVKELLKNHSSLLADGDLDKASEVMEEVLQLRDDMQNARMARQADNARNSAKIEVQYDATVQRLEAEYPEINPDSDSFDEGAVRRVQALVTGLMQSEGKNPAEALQEATDILLKPAKEAQTPDLRGKPDEEAVQQGMRRQQAQIDKNLKAAEAQPPATDAVGKDHDKTGGPLDADALKAMTFEEFVKVPDEELAKLRGDFIQ